MRNARFDPVSLFSVKDADPIFMTSELAEIALHQLAAPLATELADYNPELLANIQNVCQSAQPPIRTYHDLIVHDRPPIPLLLAMKKVSKLSGASEPGMPGPISRMIYMLAVALARTRHGKKLSTLDDAKLHQLAQRLISEPWLPDEARKVLDAFCQLFFASASKTET